MTIDVKQILEEHQLWLTGKGGKRADLSGANLYRADLSGAILSGANLYRADLFRANLSGANLSGANLSGADLSCATLSRADLSGADLSGTTLSRATLYGANLSAADLSNTNLTKTNLLTANLTSTKTPYPIYQFFVGKFNGVATSATLRIGYEEHDWDTWFQEYNNIGKKALFSEQEIDQHWQVIKLYYKLLTGKDVL